MELIFICKAGLKQHPGERSQEVYQFEKVSPLSCTISNSVHCAPESHSKLGVARFGPEALSDGSLKGGECFWPGSQGGKDAIPLDTDYKGPGTSPNHIRQCFAIKRHPK